MGGELGLVVPLDSKLASFFEMVKRGAAPVELTPEQMVTLLGQPTCELLSLKSALAYKICPRVGKQWMIGFHQCGERRTWSEFDQLFVRDVCHRLEDAITTLLSTRQADESDQLYRALFEQASDGVVVVDPTSAEILQFNERAHQNLGYSREEFAQLAISDLDAYEDSQEVQDRTLHILQHGTQIFETKHRCKDGGYRDIEVRAAPILAGGRRVLVGVWNDITLRKQAEQAREEQLWFLRSMQQVNAVIASRTELEATLNGVLDVLLEVFGCDRVTLAQIPAPGATSLTAAFQRWREGFPGSLSFADPVQISPELRGFVELVLTAEGVQEFGSAKTRQVLGKKLTEAFQVKALLVNRLEPREGPKWVIVVKQCSHEREWTEIEKNLIVEVSHRIEDALSKLDAYQKLADSRRSLEQTQDRAKLGNWEFPSADRTGYWSPQMFELFNLDPQDGPPSWEVFQTLVHPDDLAGLLASHQEMTKPESGQLITEYRTNPEHGPVKYIYSAAHKTEVNGSPRVSGLCQDITERRLNELALQQSEGQLRLFIEHAPAALAMFDLEMRYLCASRRWIADYALEGREFLGVSHYDLFPNLPKRWKLVHKRAFAGEVVAAQKDRFEHADGAVQWIHWEVHPWFTPEGTVGGIMIFAEDVTELVELNQALEGKVLERTAQLEESNQKLDEFAHSVSHDLRAPLRAVEGFARALDEDYGSALDQDARLYIDNIVSSAARMDALINDLLRYSRLARDTLRMQSVDSKKVIAEVLESLSVDLREKNAEITVLSELPVVRGHRTTLVQIFSNLVSNAAKFVEAGKPPRIRIWHELTDRNLVRFYVEDSGIGIDPKYFARIFDVFQRLHGIESYPGTGIGLAIVARACARHGGRCGVESTPGQGSRFWVEIPSQERST